MSVLARIDRRWPLRGLATVAALATVGLGVAAPGGAAAATHLPRGSHLRAAGTYYSVEQPVCATPKPDQATCFAMKRVPATRTTKDAQPYTVPAAAPVGPANGLTPSDLAAAYRFNPNGGAGQTVAVVDAYDDPNLLADLNTFDAQYGIPAETATSFVAVNQSGQVIDPLTRANAPAADVSGWSGEESLDVEAVRAVCHGCHIVLVETDSPSGGNLIAGVRAAIALHATEISNSYGIPERHLSAGQLKSVQQAYTHRGTVITAATGDDGYYSWDSVEDGVTPPNTANIPSTLPTVVATGGTSLSLNSDGTRRAERVWNRNGPVGSAAARMGSSLGATGGGCSKAYTAKRWQSHMAGYSRTGCGAMRLAADISADADPNSGLDIYDSYDCGTACDDAAPGWVTVGGTSLSSPLIAAMWALAGGSGGIADPTLSLYGRVTAHRTAVYDVTKGSNGFCGLAPATCRDVVLNGTSSPSFGNPNHLGAGVIDCAFKGTKAKAVILTAHRQCYAATGYDGPSGLGTPSGLSVFKPIDPRATIFHTPAVRKAKTLFTVQAHDPFPGSRFVTYHWSFGDGRHSHRATPSHVFSKPGRYSVTLRAVDNYGRTAQSALKVKVHK